jgi:hypothetical protein
VTNTKTLLNGDDWEAFWVDPPVHPAAAMLPMMSDAELDELAEDIKANGLIESIMLFADSVGGPLCVLDGRNRLAAFKRLGRTPPNREVGTTAHGRTGHDGAELP